MHLPAGICRFSRRYYYFRRVRKIVVFGPGPRFKGGISNFTVSLAKALEKEGAEVYLVSWTQQYPAVIPRDFIDRSSKTDLLDDSSVKVNYITNYNNPLSWNKTADFISSLRPDIVIFQWAIAIQGLPMGKIARKIKKAVPRTEIIFDVHNVVQKETGSLDKRLTRYALKAADAYIMHGQVTIDEFREFMPEISLAIRENGERASGGKTVFKLYHPVYDIFKPDPDFNIQQAKAALNLKKNVFLFFGFIRKYKGLHYAIEAFSRIASRHPDTSLLIVGESFWNTVDRSRLRVRLKSAVFGFLKSVFIKNAGDESAYNPLQLIEKYGLAEQVVVVNRFVPNEEVHRYFQLCDAVVNFYEYATPSGVESIAYNFSKPILATRVGHFANAIADGQNGYLAKAADIDDMARVMENFLNTPVPEENVKKIADGLSWSRYAGTILGK